MRTPRQKRGVGGRYSRGVILATALVQPGETWCYLCASPGGSLGGRWPCREPPGAAAQYTPCPWGSQFCRRTRVITSTYLFRPPHSAASRQ